MTASGPAPERSEDFEALYDLADPRAYYRGLAPSGYAMPAQVAQAVRRLSVGRRPFHVLDFACGYGAVGLLLRTGLSMADLYRRYADAADPSDDARAFDAAPGRWRIAGLDVAGRALAYAQAVGAVDLGFCENVLEKAPSAGLTAFLRQADLIVESGAVGGLLAPALPRLIAAAAPRRPTILYCPRPNVDPGPIASAVTAHGYAVAPYGAPVAYRKPLSAAERSTVAAAAAALGLSSDAVFDADGFMRVQMRCAQPS
ncbi:MAG: hypothetical protein RIB45_01035 [Marivibrio sp.]|uniref:hypothetical protein n=1 Tax=Marivibrio sp. TaxID=2039719 RepID=UPI0032EBF905